MNAHLIRSLLLSSAVAGVLAATGCGSSSASSPAPTTPTTTTGTLSAAFASNCAGCHGSDGATKIGSNSALKGSSTAYTPTNWQTAIRNGKGSMPPFATAAYSDVNMKDDYKVLTGLTWK